MRATLHRPASIAAAACSTSMTKDEPPTVVPSRYFGWMPRYSARCITDGPAVRSPSTSDLGMPASRRALRAASACNMSAVLPGQMPISSDSSTPTMATFLERLIGLPAHRTEHGQADLIGEVFEDDFDRHVAADLLGVRLDADQVGQHARPLLELDD